ncbi:MAG: Holliday junction branch migration protein RuvA [Oscillospiraceae bacterium]|nr:Holliday junction branch migration protein RuvA [Oscillospiraceae bacterium]
MFYSLRGKLIHTEPSMAVLECGGIGFQCMTSMNTLRSLPKLGSEATLYTHLNVREDAMDLFGFATQSELNCFRLLIAISGVGPKVALAILSELAPEQVALAVSAGDSKSLTRAAGVGPKLAQRIVLELTDKVKKMAASGGGFMPTQSGVVSASTNTAEAVNALTVLGYSATDAAAVAAKFDSSLPVEEIIRLSLKEMASRL